MAKNFFMGFSMSGGKMRINRINVPIYFGYNKPLNDEVNKKLERPKGDKALAQNLLQMNKLCMSVEDNMRLEEETSKRQAVIDDYSSILMALKPLLVEMLNNRYRHLDYKNKELETYKKEIKDKKIKDPFDWRKDLVKAIEDDDDDVGDQEFTTEELDKAYPDKNKSKEVVSNADNKKKEEASDYLEEFVPNRFSPKGFKDLGGMQKLKDQMYDKIIFPILNPEQAKLDEVEYGKRFPRGFMLYGPSGCGKTSIAQALAVETNLPMYKLKISKAGSEFVNGSAKRVQAAYSYLTELSKQKGTPIILFVDEMDAMASKRSSGTSGKEDNKVVNTLLELMEEARDNNIILICATNRFEHIDDAVRSRMDYKVYVGLPDDETRHQVLKIHLSKMTKGQPLANNDSELEKVVQLTKGFSNRDISILVDLASDIARLDGRRNITADDFIVPVKENQNMKVNENLYKDKNSTPTIGFISR